LSDSPLEGAEFEPSCATDSRRAAESWDRHRPVDGRQVHVTASRPALSGLASFPAQYTARIAGIDLFVVPTIGLKLLYGLVILGLQRRRLVWTNVTANPTAEWIAQQITTSVRSFTHKKPVRAPLPAHLPRERVVVPAPARCPRCGGKLVKLGEDVAETLEVVPRRWKVIQTVREKFSCRACEKITQPPAPFHVIPRARAGASLWRRVGDLKNNLVCVTLCWSGMDSNFQFRDTLAPLTARPW
jgi:hypothetical protein